MILYVTTAIDSVTGSLRDAINQANASCSESITIIITPSVKHEIKLVDGELTVISNINLINESGHDLTIAAESQNNRLFAVSSPSQWFKIISKKTKLTLSGGSSQTQGGAISVDVSSHLLTLKNVHITNNMSHTLGGGVYTSGSLYGVRLWMRSNQADQQGGGCWCGQSITLIHSRINNNKVILPVVSSGGGGLYVDNGDCILDNSQVNNNHVAYETLGEGQGGSGGGIIVVNGSLYVQNNSHVDNNVAYNSGGIQEGLGNVYLLNKSSASGNRSFNPHTGSSGGGGVTITKGAVYVSDSQISLNQSSAMYSSGVVSLIGDVVVTNGSKVMQNSCSGPGGAIAVNLGSVTIDAHSYVCKNVGASLGAGIVCLTPSPAYISVSNGSHVSDNTLTNVQTIQQTIGSFFKVIINHLISEGEQASLSGSVGGQTFNAMLPSIVAELKVVFDQLEKLPIDSGHKIGGGGIASLLTANILINDSYVENNFCGEKISTENIPFEALGGGLYTHSAEVSVQGSQVTNNLSLSYGGGIWAGGNLNMSHSKFSKNKVTDKNSKGGGIFNNGGRLTLIGSQVTQNIAKSDGGGLYTELPITKYKSKIVHNQPNNINQIQ